MGPDDNSHMPFEPVQTDVRQEESPELYLEIYSRGVSPFKEECVRELTNKD